MPGRSLTLIVAGLLLTSTGCQTMMSPQAAWRQTVSMFRPDSRDYGDSTEDDGSEWDFVGDQGRADQQRERDPDPWFKQNLMSAKARSIEHNLGID
jgi:hypothetical protein